MSEKGTIPCSVSLLTLNAADTLPACLDRLKDFADIIICDGNSTDGTQEVAKRYGARVIKQYDTDESNVPCAMDKATVRERAMAASKYEWRFFMDADDTLSEEAVEEIRAIVSKENPEHLIWRMPTRIFIDGKEILYEATYPSYQTRLVHASVGARFKGPVHDHLVWDTKKFPVGTMSNYYNFEWPRERVANYWKYTRTYVRRELDTMQFHRMTPSQLWRWVIYFRLRIFLGYVLWRLPLMYLRHGFKDTMPLSIESMVAGQHLLLFGDGIKRYFGRRPWFIFLTHVLSGNGLSEARRNIVLQEYEAYGRVLDVGGSADSSYWRYLQKHRWHRDTFATEHELPSLSPKQFDTILAFLPGKSKKEILESVSRFARPGGRVIGGANDALVFSEEIK